MDDFSQGVITDASEFGAVDNPALGGYTEPNWNVGAWGDNIASTEDQGIALPESVLRQYGNPRHPDFGKSFNQNYQVDLIHPETGEPVVQDVPLRDLGPSPRTGKGIDMMYATARAMGQDIRGGGQVGFRITPRAEPVEQENVPRGTNTGPPPPAWQDVENSQEFQGINQDQKLQVLDAWHKQVYGYANQLGGFDEQSRGNLYDFYNSKRQSLAKPSDLFGQAEKSAEIAATQADLGAAQAQVHAAHPLPLIDTSTITDPQQKAEAEKLNEYVRQQDISRYSKQVQQAEPRLAEQQKAIEGMGPPNEVARTIGGIAPSIPTALLGPGAIPAFAAQFGAQAYEQGLEEARAEIKANHKHWNPDQQDIIANEVANRASQYATMSALALGSAGVRLPIKGFILRALASAGLGATAQGAAASVAQMGENQAMQALQPGRSMIQGVPEAFAKGAAVGGIAAGVHGALQGPTRSAPNQADRAAPQPEPHPVQPGEILGKPGTESTSPDIVQPGREIVPGIHEATVPEPGAGLYAQRAPAPQAPVRVADLQSVSQGLSPTGQRILSLVPNDVNIVQGNETNWDPGSRTITLRDPGNATDLIHEAVHAVMQDHADHPAVIEAWRNFVSQAKNISKLPMEYHYALQSPEEHMAAALSDPGYQKLIGKKGMEDITEAVNQVINGETTKSGFVPAEGVISRQSAFRKKPKENEEGEEAIGMLWSPGIDEAVALRNRARQDVLNTPRGSQLNEIITKNPNAPPEVWDELIALEKSRLNELRSNQQPRQHALSLQNTAPGNNMELPAKRGWKPSLDILHDYQGTRDLWSRVQNWNALKGQRQGEVNQVEDLYNKLRKDHPTLSPDVHTFMDTRLQGKPATPKGNEIQFLNAATQLVSQQEQQAKALGVKAPSTDLGMIRRDYLEAMLKPLEKNGQPTAKARALFLTGQNNGTWTDWNHFLRDASKFRQIHEDAYQGLRASPLEKGVTTPGWMQTHSADAIMQVLRNNAEALARIEAFGPDMAGHRLAFQQAVNAISNDYSLSKAQRDNAKTAIQHVKNTVEGTLPIPGQLGKTLKKATTLSMASGPMTAFGRILPSELLRTFGQHGPFREGAAVIKSLNPAAWKQQHDWLRSMDLPMQVRRGMLNDLYSDQGPWQQGKVMQAGMWLHKVVQNYGRKVAALSARAQLEKDLIPAMQAGPQSSGHEFAQQEIARRGLNPQDFANPNVSQELRDAYVHNTVLDTQTSFDPMKSPMFGSESVQGQYMMQFGHWPQESARGLLRETINPLGRAVAQGDRATAGRYMTRLMWTALAAPLGTEAINAVRTGVFGKQDENATWGEIWGMMLKHSPYLTAALGQRLVNDVFAGPVWGTFGDVAMAAWNAYHNNWTNIIAWDPTHPAVLGVMKGLYQLVQRATAERHIPSMKEIRDALRQSAVGPAQLWNAYENLGGPTPWSYMDKGYQDRDFARRSYTLWQKLTGQALQSRQEGVTAGLRTPYYNDIADALYSGDVKAAHAILQRLMAEQGESLKKAGAEIDYSIHARAPIPPQNHKAFLRSAPEILEPQEMQRMMAVQHRYYQTAVAAGLIHKIPN